MSKEDLQLKLKEYEQDKKDVDARIKSLEFSLYISKQNQEYLKREITRVEVDIENYDMEVCFA